MTVIPPHNLDAERAVLGAMLLEGREALPRVIEVLRPADFYTEAHRTLYEGILRLFNRGEPVDIITLSEELRRTDQLIVVGGPAALALLVEEASVSVNLLSYVGIVRGHGAKREFLALGERLRAGAMNGASAADLSALAGDVVAQHRARDARRRPDEAIPSEATAFLAHRFPVRRDIVARGVLPRGGLAVLNAPPKTHKTMLADNLMLARSRGAPWLGLPTDPGVTLGLQAEHSPASWQRRLAVMTAHDPEPLVAGRLYLRTLRGIALNTGDGLAVVHRLLDETGADLLRLDPLARYMVGRENSNDEDGMGGVVRAIDTILERGVAVLLVHHQGKPSKDDPRRGGLSLRGGSALFAAADAVLTVERDGSDAVTVNFELRDAPPLAPMRLTVTPDLWMVSAGPDPELAKLGHLVATAPLPYRTLVGAARQDLGLSESTAKRRINAALAAGLLEKDSDGLYRLGSRVHEGSDDA